MSRPEDLAEAARMLRVVVEALPPRSARDRATVRRVEGAAVALDAAAGHLSNERLQDGSSCAADDRSGVLQNP